MKFSAKAALLTALIAATTTKVSSQTSPPSAPIVENSTRSLFEKVAGELEFLDLNSLLYNRDHIFARLEDPKGEARYFKTLQSVLEPAIPIAEITPLLQSENARVRTLALSALFGREDPQLLPFIVALAGDKAITFPGYGQLYKTWLSMTDIGPPPEKQSVGDVASKMVDFYLGNAGFNYGIGHDTEAGWAKYWRERKDRRFAASWFAVKLARASRSTSPTQENYRADIRAVRAEIETLPTPDRDWTLLFLNGDTGSDFLASDAELLAAAKRRSAKELLAVLREKVPSDDPDLQSRASNNWTYQRTMLWILERAPQLLTPAMADDVLACEQFQRDYLKRGNSDPLIVAAWPVAAARLQPKRAESILRAAWTRFSGKFDGDNRVQIAAAIAFSNLPAQNKFVLDWFYAPAPKEYEGVGSTGKGNAFISRLSVTRGAERIAARRFLGRLVNDTRFATTDFNTIRALGEMANADTKTPIIDIQKLYERAWIGQQATSPDAKKALSEARGKLHEIYVQRPTTGLAVAPVAKP